MAAAKKRATPATKPAAKRDALELWDHDGRLAEAMRAGGFKIGTAAFAVASLDTCIQDDEVRVRIIDGARVYSAGGDDYARLTLVKDTLVLQFKAPKQKDDLDAAARFYRPVKGKPGWLEYERPATRDPRPDLEAKLGSILGQAAFERSKGRR